MSDTTLKLPIFCMGTYRVSRRKGRTNALLPCLSDITEIASASNSGSKVLLVYPRRR